MNVGDIALKLINNNIFSGVLALCKKHYYFLAPRSKTEDKVTCCSPFALNACKFSVERKPQFLTF